MGFFNSQDRKKHLMYNAPKQNTFPLQNKKKFNLGNTNWVAPRNAVDVRFS